MSLTTIDTEEEESKQIIDTGVHEDENLIHQCKKQLPCGHQCKGVDKERNCLPCLNSKCAKTNGLFEGIDEDELCTICYTSELGAEACTKLSCGHVFHTNCLIQLLKHKWPTLRITFGFLACPSCNQEIKPQGLSRPVLKELG